MSDERNWYDNTNNDNSNNSGNSNWSGNNNYYGNNSSSYGPVDAEGTNSGFAKASMIFGIISVATIMTGIIPVMTGAAGTLFAILSRRRGKALPRRARVGLPVSVAGMVIGLIITISSVVSVYGSIKSGEFWNDFGTMYEQMYGEEFNWKDFGIDPEGFETFQDYIDQAGTIEG